MEILRVLALREDLPVVLQSAQCDKGPDCPAVRAQLSGAQFTWDTFSVNLLICEEEISHSVLSQVIF